MGPYCTVKLIDLPENPTKPSLPWTKFYRCKGLNKHANDLYALRTMLIVALSSVRTNPMFEGDHKPVLALLNKHDQKQINSALDAIGTIIQEKSKLASIGEKEREIVKQASLLTNLITPLKKLPPYHKQVLLTLACCIGKLSLGIEKTHFTHFGVNSQLEVIKTVENVKHFLQTKLGVSGPTGSPMKPAPLSSSKRKLSKKRLVLPAQKK